MEGCTQGRNEEAGSVFKTEDDFKTLDQALKAMELHVVGHKLGAAALIVGHPAIQNQSQSRIPKSISPKVEMGISSQEWDNFIVDWK